MLNNLIKKIAEKHLLEVGNSEYYRRFTIQIIGLFGLVIIFSFSVTNFLVRDYFAAFLELTLSLCILVAFYLQWKAPRSSFPMHLGVLVTLIMLVNNTIVGGFDHTGYYLNFFFPVIVYLLVGVAYGVYYTFLYFMIVIILGLLRNLGFIELPYTNIQNLIYILSFSGVSLLVIAYQRINEGAQLKIAAQKDDLQLINRNLSLQVSKLQQSEKELDKHFKELEIKNSTLENAEAAILNVFEDVEEEKYKVFEEKERLNTILHSIGDGVVVLDINERVVMANESVEMLTGFQLEELMQKKFRTKLQFINEKTRESDYRFLDNVFDKGVVSQINPGTLLIKKDLVEMPVGDSSSPIINSEGAVIGCVVVFRDITKEREVDRMKSEFVSVASHQLRTPLTGIRWYLELLKDSGLGKFSAEQREFFNNIEESNNRMIKLVEDLLNVSRIEVGRKFSISKVITDFIPLVQETIKDQKIIADQKKIQIIVDESFPKFLRLHIDPEKIAQVLKNLVSNAIKYSPNGTKIEISYHLKGKEHIFSVKDQGLGIPKKSYSDMFKKFFRADNAVKTQTEGTGLGLYISKAIIEGHGGKIWFESKLNKGTIFYFSLL
ncbi:MAG: ATP-binding protein [bacterium]